MTDAPSPTRSLTLQPMIHVRDMAEAVSFYEGLGGSLVRGSRDGDWSLIEIGGGQISLLAHPPNPDQSEGIVELNFEARVPLETISSALSRRGLAVGDLATAPAFGRQLQLTTPDGLLIKINEIADDL